jgi:DNA-binding MarR family transcriptional regulator
MTTDDLPGQGGLPSDLVALARDTELPGSRRVAAMFHSFDVARRVVEGATSLSAAELRLLWLLSDGRARTQREITSELNLDQSTVNRQVNAAIRAGHLKRVDDERGPALLTATKAGLRRYETEVEAVLDVMETALNSLGKGQQKFLESLAKFVEAYRAEVRPPGSD